MNLRLSYSIILQFVQTIVFYIIPEAESSSCQCTCNSNNANGASVLAGFNSESNSFPGSDIGGGGNNSNGLNPLASVRSGPTLPEDRVFCAVSDPSKCICYDKWKKDMDRVIYIPCLEGCNQWNNWFEDCKRKTPGQTYEWYAYNCHQCNNKYNYLNACVLKAANAYVELLVETAEQYNEYFNGC